MPKEEKVATQVKEMSSAYFNELYEKLKQSDAYTKFLFGNDINVLSKEEKDRLRAITSTCGVTIESDTDFCIFQKALTDRVFSPRR